MIFTGETVIPTTPRTDYSISLGKANLIGIPLFIMLAGVVVVPYGLIWGWTKLFLAFNEFMVITVFLPALIIGIVVHEGLHGLGWSLFGKQPYSVIKYGFNVRTITPYAHCTVPLQMSAYRAGTALPGIVLGVIPALIGIVTGSGFFIMFAAFFLGAASGDFLCLWIMRSLSPETFIKDHPTRAGCIVIS